MATGTFHRRTFLKGALAAGAGAAVAAAPAQAREPATAPDDAVGMLYDATKCIGCKTCVVACRQANELPQDDTGRLYNADFDAGLYDAPVDLSAKTKNIIKLYREGDQSSFMKAQCMHCIDPACVNACMIGALKKRELGIVTWDSGRCIGCRYCQMACPYNIPKFEWSSAAPKIVKCEMCNHLLARGGIPACCDVCPPKAVIFGPYADLLAEARRRLAESSDRYYPKIFGETDGGGTQVLYLAPAGISFDKLGLPDLGDEPVPELARGLQHGIYQGFVAPAALYAVLGAVLWRNRKKGSPEGEEEAS